jgi:CO/xanthine dehydrogenase Mo-binding subunit
MARGKITRRGFLIGTGWVVGGLTVVGAVGYAALPPLPTFAVTDEDEIGTWVQLLADGRVQFYVPRAEMGQGISTGLSQVVAEELCLPIESVSCLYQATDVMAPCQMTVGSQSIENYFELTARAAAYLRETLRDRAAALHRVAADSVTQADGGFEVASAGFVSYQDLTGDDDAAVVPLLSTDTVTLLSQRPFSECKVLGKSVAPVRVENIVRGTEIYSRDVRLPGMHYGLIARAPQLGATLQQFNRAAAEAVNGIVAVVEHNDQVGVVANTPMAAARGLAALDARWQSLSAAELDRAQVSLDIDQFIKDGRLDHAGDEHGSITAERAQSSQHISFRYDSPMVAHAAMEPRSGVAHYHTGDDGRAVCEVWTGSQDPWLIQTVVASELGIDKSAIAVNNHRVGGAFGGRVLCQASVEAAWLSKAVSQPVKVQWSREDEFRYNYVGPQFSTRIDAGLTAEGRIGYWHHRAVGAPVLTSSMFFPQYLHWLANQIPDPGTQRGMTAPYTFTSHRSDFADERVPMPTGPWRGLGAAPNTFAIECAMDELALAANTDPIAFRLQHLDNSRLAHCLKRLQSQLQDGNDPVGIAAAVYKGVTYLAIAAHVSIEAGRIRVTRLTCVHDCGRVISPDRVLAQIEGNLVWGIGMALTEEFKLVDGIAETDNFDRYSLPGQRDVPDFAIELVDSDEPPSGAAEAAIAPVAAAIANAVFAATGERRRQLPLA